MSELDKYIDLVITAQTKTPTRQGFGTPCVAGYHTVFAERTRIYEDVDGMITDGFTASDPIVLAVNATKAQTPSPPQVIVGRTENDEAMKVTITPNSADLRANSDYKFYHNGVEAKYTTDSTPTVSEITAGLAAAIAPAAWLADTIYSVGDHVINDTGPIKIYICIQGGTSDSSGGPTGTGSGIVDDEVEWDYVGPKSDLTAADNTTHVTVDAAAVGSPFTYYVDNFNLLGVNDITPDGSPDGIVVDLTAIRAENDDWYHLTLANQGAPVVDAAATYINTLDKIMFVSSADADVLDASASDDILSELQTAGYDRTALIWHPKSKTQYPGAAWAGKGLPYDPGSITWAYQELVGVDYVDLNATQQNTIESKDGNYYNRVSGLSSTKDGRMVNREWIDTIRFIDWLKARIQEAIFGRLHVLNKIPYTDQGVTIITNEIWGVLRLGISRGGLAATPEPTVTAPLVADVSTADKTIRLLPDIRFEGTLSGAIHKTRIRGVVSV